MLVYNRLPHTVFTDTLLAGTLSSRPNKYGQVFALSYGWSRFNPMHHKGESREDLSLLFKRYGVPPDMVADGSKEKNLDISSVSVKRLTAY